MVISFDEWFTCRNGGPDLKLLWDKYYKPAVSFALQNTLYKQKIEKEFNNGRSFLGLHREFKKKSMNFLGKQQNKYLSQITSN